MAENPNDQGGVRDDIVKRLEARFQDFSGVTIQGSGCMDCIIAVDADKYTELGFERIQTVVDSSIKSGEY